MVYARACARVCIIPYLSRRRRRLGKRDNAILHNKLATEEENERTENKRGQKKKKTLGDTIASSATTPFYSGGRVTGVGSFVRYRTICRVQTGRGRNERGGGEGKNNSGASRKPHGSPPPPWCTRAICSAVVSYTGVSNTRTSCCTNTRVYTANVPPAVLDLAHKHRINSSSSTGSRTIVVVCRTRSRVL